LVAKSRQGVALLVMVVTMSYVGGLALINILPQGSGFQTRLLELTQPAEYEYWETQSVTTRLDDFRGAIDVWLSRPILGRGFIADVSHNLFLGILVETGVVGLVLFIGLWLSTTRRFLQSVARVAISRDEARLIRIAVLAYLACIMVQLNISGGRGGGYHAYLILGAMLGVIGFADSQARPERIPSQPDPCLAASQER